MIKIVILLAAVTTSALTLARCVAPGALLALTGVILAVGVTAGLLIAADQGQINVDIKIDLSLRPSQPP
ncbi:MAG: hypothetical protein ACOYXW_11015 [Actinomycetota bacterium]